MFKEWTKLRGRLKLALCCALALIIATVGLLVWRPWSRYPDITGSWTRTTDEGARVITLTLYPSGSMEMVSVLRFDEAQEPVSTSTVGFYTQSRGTLTVVQEYGVLRSEYGYRLSGDTLTLTQRDSGESYVYARVEETGED